MQTKDNKRPASCKHMLYPSCGCVAPRTEEVEAPVAADLIYRRDVAAIKPRAVKKPGRPKLQRPDEHEDFLARLPLILDDPTLSSRLGSMILAEECRRSLSRFCREAWQVIEPATKLEWNWHHELLCNILQGIFEEWERAREDRRFRMRVNNLLVNVPPGTAKSRLLSCFFPTWVWLRAPGAKFLCLSTNEDASLRDARDSKGLIQSEWFQDTFQPQWQLLDNQEANSNYANSMGGVRISKGQGAKVIGLRADFLCIDDANDPTEVESKTKRDGVNILWKDTIYNRVNHPERSVRIGIQQRTHEEDWSGYVLKKEGVWDPEKNPKGWLHVCLPAEFDPDRRCVTPWGSDPRIEKNEPLHWSTKQRLAMLMKRAFERAIRVGEPLEDVVAYSQERIQTQDPVGRLSPEFLQKERERLGSTKYSGLMQQRPTAAEGGTVKLAWWRFFQYDHGSGLLPVDREKRAPQGLEMDRMHPTLAVGKRGTYVQNWDFDWTVISVDAAAKRTERGSQHGILVVSGKGPKRFIRDDRTCRGDILDVIRIIKELCAVYDPDRLIIEAKAMGHDLATLFHATMRDGDVRGSNGKPLIVVVDEYEPGSASKEARLDSCLPELEAGLVFVPEQAPWLEPFLGEVCGYPLASNDDRVDSLSMCLNFMRIASNYQLPSW